MTLSFGSGVASAMGIIVLLAKATLLLIAALGVTALLQRASAGTRHLVWVGIIAALLVLPGLSAWSPLRVAILPSAITEPPAQERATFVGPVVPPVDPRRIPDTVSPVLGESAPVAPAPARMSSWRIALAIWAAVAAGLAAWLFFGFLSVRRIVRRGRALDGRDWTAPLYEIADRLGIPDAPRLVRSDAVRMPFACGLVRPTIVLPAESDEWSAERRSAVLMHELAHIRRRDILGHTLGRLACAVYWFHPLVWTAARRLRVESERACDDLALTCGLRATTYAEHLLDIVTSIRQPQTPAAAIPMAHRREFEGRMLAILDPDLRRRSGRWQSLSLVGAVATMVVVVGAAAPAPRAAVEGGTTAAVEAPVPPDAANDTKPVDVGKSSPARQSPAARLSSTEAGDDAQRELERESDTDAGAGTGAAMRSLLQGRSADDRPKLLMQVVLNDTSANLRRVAAWGLSRYADQPEVGKVLAATLIRDKVPSVREMAAWSLASGEDSEDAIKALSAALLQDTDADVRETSAWALGNIGAEDAVDVLSAAALRDASQDIRAIAIWALGNAGLDKAPKVVLAALSDSSRSVRRVASWALYHIEDPEAAPALEAALSRETDKSMRIGYLRALGAVGEASAPSLARLLDSPDPEIREVVVAALAGRGMGPWPWPMPRPRPSP